MKKALIILAIVFSGILFMVSCSKKGDNNPQPVYPTNIETAKLIDKIVPPDTIVRSWPPYFKLSVTPKEFYRADNFYGIRKNFSHDDTDITLVRDLVYDSVYIVTFRYQQVDNDSSYTFETIFSTWRYIGFSHASHYTFKFYNHYGTEIYNSITIPVKNHDEKQN